VKSATRHPGPRQYRVAVWRSGIPSEVHGIAHGCPAGV